MNEIPSKPNDSLVESVEVNSPRELRTIADHIVSGDQAVQLKIEVLDGPSAGGACHDYLISGYSFETPNGRKPQALIIQFQNGPIKEAGVNGITGEALTAILIDRLRGFQAGPFACKNNAKALAHYKKALRYLQRRTVERIARNVEGTHTA